MTDIQFTELESQCQIFLKSLNAADAAHDLNHIFRVVKVAKQLAIEENAELAVVVPSAWLHDCVNLSKNHPQRHLASQQAGDKAIEFLASIGYSSEYYAEIHHAICAHSFSANIAPKTIEAKVVQDADRLDALGAVGVARCMQVSGSLNRALYSSEDPFCETRAPDDVSYSIDHFYKKLFKITETLQTASAQQEGKKREAFMRIFLNELSREI